MADFWESDAVATSDSDWWKQDDVKPSTSTVTAPAADSAGPDGLSRNLTLAQRAIMAQPGGGTMTYKDQPFVADRPEDTERMKAWVNEGLPFHKLAASAQTVQDAFDVLKAMQNGSVLKTAGGERGTMQEQLEGPSTPPGTAAKVTAGAVAAGLTVPETMTSPFGIVTLGAGAAGPAVARVVSGAFAADLARHTPEQVVDVYEAFKLDLGPEEATKRIGALTLNAAMIAATAKHAATAPKPVVEATDFVKPGDLLPQPVVREFGPWGNAPLEVAAVKAEAAGAPATAEAVRAQAIEFKLEPSLEPLVQTPYDTSGLSPAEKLAHEKFVEGFFGENKAIDVSEPKPAVPETIPPAGDTKAPVAETPESAADPKIIGMGGAIPSEFESGRGTATGIKNAQVDKERVSRGQDPIMGPARQATADVWDRVMSKVDNDPGWQDRLLDEVSAKPRALTPDETLALDHRYVDLQNEYAKATRDGAQHYADKYEPGVLEAKERAAFFEGKLNELEQVAKTVGTESGRSLQMRKQMLKEDFTLAAMESKMRASKGFEPLTAEEHAEVASLYEKLATAEKAAVEAEQRSSERIAILEADKSLAEAKARAVTGPEYEPRVLQAAEKFAKFMDKKGEDALVRIRQRLGRVSAGVDPTILADIGILGAAKITRGTVDFAKWTDAMVRDLGEWFREHAQQAWDISQKSFAADLAGFHKGVDKATVEKVSRAATDISGRTEDIKKTIQEKAAKGDGPPLHSEVQKLVRLLVEQDPKITRDGLIDAVHGILKESLPDITRLEAMDAISGRGKFWTPSQDEISKRVRDLGTQIRLVGHQIDVEAGRPMPRTGYQPEKFSEASVVENKKLHELMKQYGVVVTDPTKQLGSILQALKTRLQTEKVELERRIANKDFSPRRKTRDVPLDAAASTAKADVQLLRDRFARMLEKNRYDLKSTAEKVWIGAKEALNLSRSILTSWDVSAVFRQGGFIALGNPIRAARALAPMFRALVSERNAAAVEAQIQSRPNAKLYAQSKLFLAPREGTKLSGMEEAFMSRLASRIPGVGASGRAYITFLNKLRADTFDALHDNLVSGKSATPEELSAIANYINIATGRGNLGKAAGAAETLSTAFFAPRLVASRFQLLGLEPMYRGSSATRYLVAKEYAKFLSGLAVVYGLGMLAGATVEEDPRSTEFGKLKFGNTRVDPMAGLSQTTVLLSRLGSGETKTAQGRIEPIRGNVRYGHKTSADVIATFLRTKLSPVIGSAVDIASGKNVVGEPVTAGSLATNLLTPLSLRDIYDIMREQGIAAGTIMAILSLFGMSVQNYQSGQKRK